MRRIAGWLFVLALAVYGFTAGGSLTTSDAVQAFDVTRNIVERGTVEMSADLSDAEALRGPDGRVYSPFGLVQSLYNIPFYLAGRAAAALTGGRLGKPDTIPKAAVALGQTFVTAAIVWQIFRFATSVTGAIGPSLLAALTFAFGSLLWPYARFGFNQPLAALTLLLCVRFAWLGVRRNDARHVTTASVWWSIGLMTRHELGLALLPIAGWLWFSAAASSRERVRRLAAFAPGAAAGIAAWLGYNFVRFGNPFDSGHLRDPVPGFGSSAIDGVLGLLFSPSTSIVLYSPVVVASIAGLAGPLWRRDRATAAWIVAICLTFLLFYATLGNWIGGRSYGSRYLLIVLPLVSAGWAALLAALDRRRRRVLFACVLAVGVVVQLPGVLVDYAKVSQAATADRGSFSTRERQWSWPATPLVLNTRAAIEAVPANVGYVLGRTSPPAVAGAGGADDRGFSQQFAFSLDFWWLYLFYMGALPRAGLRVVAAVGLIAVAGSAAALRRAIRAAGAV